MLNKTHRFHGHNALKFVYQHGRSIRAPLWAIKYTLNEHRQVFRMAVVVSKKVSKSAVLRNRIRRRFYNLLRPYQDMINQPYDIVITVFHEDAATVPAEELATGLRRQLQQAGIIKLAAPTKGDPEKPVL